jgi:hypothetical protein
MEINKTNNRKCWKGCGGERDPYTLWWTSTMEMCIEVPQKTKNRTTI